MVADKAKYFYKTKFFIITIWFAYLIIYNTKISDHLPVINDRDVFEKKNLTIRNGIALIGGSNVRMGLSAEIISDKSNECINFGVNGENGGFSGYLNWIEGRIFPDIVIYSPLDIWSQTPLIKNTFLDFIPTTSIISQINAAFFKDTSINFNSCGDQLNYICGDDIQDIRINQQKFILSNVYVVNEFKSRVEKLKKITRTDKVLIRVPPIYVDQCQIKFYTDIINLRINALKEAGIILIGKTIISSDKSLFCDVFHPNEKGRMLFSNELKEEYRKLDFKY